MNAHVDLIRNDWEKDQQTTVARIYVAPDAYGLMIKDATGEHFEGNIFDTLGSVAHGPGDQIVETLQRSFHGPYLLASEVHEDAKCPFNQGPLPIEREKVVGAYTLPPPLKS